MNTFYLLLGFTVAVALVLIWAEFFAPEGYEDQNGFHLGREPRTPC